MIQISKTNSDNYFSFLSEVFTDLKNGGHFSMAKSSTKYKVHFYTSAVMQKCGLIQSNGMKGLAAKWEWKTIPPNENMAIELIKKLNQFQPEKKEKPAPPIMTVKPEALAARKELLNHDQLINQAVTLLKNNGYKILKPTYVEV